MYFRDFKTAGKCSLISIIIVLSTISASVSFSQITDNDADGMDDAWELANGFDPSDPADGQSDFDNDGLVASQEFQTGADINLVDTDFDGLGDYEEVLLGKDPTTKDNPLLISAYGDTTCSSIDSKVYCWGAFEKVVDQSEIPTTSNVTDLEVGREVACVVDNKKLKCWGQNPSWLGVTYDVLDIPQSVQNADVKAISVGFTHACAVLESDQAICWGENASGSINLPSLSDIREVRANGHSTCILDNSGVRCIGDNFGGRIDVPALTEPRFISRSSNLNCALDNDDEVACWGQDTNGDSSIPADLAGSRMILTGGGLSCSISTQDSVRCWGDNTHLELDVPLLETPRSLAVGRDHACATTDRGVVCWGANNTSQLEVANALKAELDFDEDGIPDFWEKSNGLNYLDPIDATQISSDGVNTNLAVYQQWNSARDSDSDGINNQSEEEQGLNPFDPDSDNDTIGDGTELELRLDPSNPADAVEDFDNDGLNTLEEIQSGTHIRAADSDFDGLKDGEEISLGKNPLVRDFEYQLDSYMDSEGVICLSKGNDVTCWNGPDDVTNPANIPQFTKLEYLSVGPEYACVIDDGLVECWGAEAVEQTSGATYDVTDVPVSVTQSRAVWLSTGDTHACALLENGQGVCWGDNQLGQLAVPVLSQAKQIEAGRGYSCALDETGVQCWGGATWPDRVAVPADFGVPNYISVGPAHTCGLKDGIVRCFGANFDNQVSPIPSNLENVWAVSARHINSCAIGDHGLSCWGWNGFDRNTVPSMLEPRLVTSNRTRGCALDATGVICWGESIQVPTSLQVPTDIDEDQIADDWELENGYSPLHASDASTDPDGNGLTALQEYQALLATVDSDNDGLSDIEEANLGTLANNPDSDGDEMPDGWEVTQRLDPLVNDAALDKDSDGLSNLEEYQAGTNPNWHDTDKDGLSDIEELSLGTDPTVKDFGIDLSGNADNTDSGQCAIRDRQVECWGEGSLFLNVPIPAVVDPVQVSVGIDVACVLDQGEVKCWGSNNTSFIDDVATANTELGNIVEIGVGHYRACAIDSNGKLFCWGNNSSNATSDAPLIDDAIDLTVGYVHSCVTRKDRSVECWGDNTYGESTVPADINEVLYIEAGYYSSCAVTDAGLRCWGFDNLGNISSTPTGLMGVTQIRNSGWHTCVVADDELRCWGDNSYGEAVDNDSFTNIRRLVVGRDHTCTLSDAGVECHGNIGAEQSNPPATFASKLDIDTDGLPDDWESNNGLSSVDASDALSDIDNDGLTATQEYQAGSSPVDGDNDGITDAQEASLGTFANNPDSDGDEMPDGWEVTQRLDPLVNDAALDKDSDGLSNLEEYQAGSNPNWHDTDKDGLSDIEELSLGSDPTVKDFGIDLSGNADNTDSGQCAIRDKQVECWGEGSLFLNVPIPAVVDPVQVSVGIDVACVLDQGEVKCWGSNNTSFIDDVATANTELGDIVEIGVGHYRACAIDSNGKLFCWGNNSSNATSDAPLIDDAIDLTVGYVHSCVTRQDRSIECWGENTYGESTVPADINEVLYIEAGYYSSCAVTDGGLRCWGFDNKGNISSTPTGLTGVTQIRNSGWHTCVVADDELRCWGDNSYGEAVDNDSFTNIRRLVVGRDHTCTLSDAGVECHGNIGAEQSNPPATFASKLDIDTDGLPDDWESNNGLSSVDASDALSDIDNDGLTATQEYQAGSSPVDGDNDGITDAQEASLGTFANNPDSDGDEMPDGWEVTQRLDPLVNDAALDKDSDGLSNLEEYQAGTNPNWHDTDKDGLSDAEELSLGSNPLIKDFGIDLSGNADNADSGQCAIRDRQVECWGEGSLFLNVPIPAVVDPVQVSVGIDVACVLDQGEVKCWGSNNTSFIDDVATANTELGDIVEIGVGHYRACAIDSNGKLFCWGNNSSNATSNAPLIDDAIDLTVGYVHSCVTRKDRSIECWGENTFGESTVPADINEVLYIEAGYYSSCAVTDAGLRCWGFDNLGNISSTPTGLMGVTQIRNSGWHTCVVADDELRCWGDNSYGEAVDSDSFTNIRRLVVGRDHTCTFSDARVECHGNVFGEQADTPDSFADPLDIDADGLPDDWESKNGLSSTNPSDATLDADGDLATALEEYQAGTSPIDADNDGVIDADEPSLGLLVSNPDSDGDLMPDGWEVRHGLNPLVQDASQDKDQDLLSNLQEYQAGTNPNWHDSDRDGLPDADELIGGSDPSRKDLGLDLSASYDTTCAIRDNQIHCWGSDASIVNPANFPNVIEPTQISVGRGIACVLDQGEVKCWGTNNSSMFETIPSINQRLGDIVEIGVGHFRACAVDADGKLLCWGNNSSNSISNTPIIKDAIAIDVGYVHSCVTRSDRSVQCWGSNGNGESSVPEQLTPVDRIVTDFYSSCAITQGSLDCWVYGDWQDSTGSAIELNNVTHLAMSREHFCAVDDGDLLCTGNNSYGEATPDPTASGILKLAAGRNHTCYLTSQRVGCFGLDAPQTQVPDELKDRTKPFDVRALTASTVSDTEIELTWTLPAFNVDDIDAYEVAVPGLDLITAPSGIQSLVVSGLTPSTVSSLTVVTVDAVGNRSDGVSTTFATAFENPNSLNGQALSNSVILTWQLPAERNGIVAQRLYQSATPFSSVEGLTPAFELSNDATQQSVGGLQNGVPYYFAITSVNSADFETKTVTPLAVTPEADTVAPAIQSVSYGSASWVPNLIVANDDQFCVTVSDQSQISRVEFAIDAATDIVTTPNQSGAYCFNLQASNLANGAYAVAVAAFDVFENNDPQAYAVQIQLAPPASPTISNPATGLITNQSRVDVTGVSIPGLEVQLLVNGTEGEWITVNATGQFQLEAFLNQEGDNLITTRARNRSGVGAESAPITVTLDTSLPAKPIGVSAELGENGIVSLNWATGTGGRIASFEVYRSQSEDFDIPNTGRINASPVTGTNFSDVLTANGTYYYKVVSLNEFDVRSEPSASTSVNVDVTDPYAELIEYSIEGAFDAANQVYGQGILDVTVTVNEQLLTTPFLSISPDGGVPISVPLVPVENDQLQYNGKITLDENVRSGTAYAVFSARDKAGNRGTLVNQGGQIQIDTAGPIVTAMATTPETPIKNDAETPVSVTVQFTVDETLDAANPPVLRYTLASLGSGSNEVSDLVKLADKQWQANINLSADSGASAAETLSIYFDGQDGLGNTTVSANPTLSVQVYQGELPPLEQPFNFRGTAIADGQVELQWFEVANAASYKIYRREAGLGEFLEVTELVNATSYIDQTPQDATYEYQLTSIRNENSELAESTPTETVTVTTDSVPPASPADLTLELFPIGIQADWSPVSESGVRYELFTAAIGPITDITTLQPVLADLDQPFVVDTNASEAKPAYVVVAVDAVGNKSAPSNTAYLNVDLLPVSSLNVRVESGSLPVLSWTHSKPSISGFDVFFGPDGQSIQLNDSLVVQNQFTDNGYANTTRTYSVVAVDSNDERSLPRFISLPQVSLSIDQDTQIKRNLINQLSVTVTNQSQAEITNARVKLISAEGNFQSASFSLAASASVSVPMTIGGLESLPDYWTPSLELHASPNAGEQIQIAQQAELQVRDSAMSLALETEGFIRGADGTARFSITNSGDQPVQLITASNQGNANSPDISFTLRDEDDNVLSVSGVRQALGADLVNNAQGEAVLTLDAGQTWQSDAVTVRVPQNAPDTVFLALDIAQLYANRGSAEQVTIQGPNTRQQLQLAETPYRGEVVSITPQNSFGDQPIVITGQALERGTDRALSGVDLQIIIALNGFERSFEAITDANGQFELTYQPQKGESGVYKVSLLHPIQTSRPNNGQFVISRLTLTPSLLDLQIPYGLDYNIPITFRAGEGTELNNLRFELEPQNQPDGMVPTGIQFAYPSIPLITSTQRITESITVTATDAADPTGQFIISIYSDESPATPIGFVDATYSFSEAKPALGFSPSILELGTTLDGTSTGSITLENKGLAPLKGVNLTLKTADGFPAFDWLQLTTQSSLGDIAVGETAKADILLQPDNQAPTGIERFVLEVRSSNAPTYQIPIVTSVVESGEGGVLIKVTDMYSGTLNSVGQVIQGLAAANVRIQNESDPSIQYLLTADQLGEVFVNDIPAGRYSVWVSAPNYREVHQRLRIQPGLITSSQIFLDYELIRLEWSVNEILLEDKYEIVLRATYETDVPAAVVMIEPTNIKLPAMQPGDVFHGEVTLANYGLIRAFDINFTPQTSDEFYQFEYLEGVVPDSLEAKEQVVVPYKVTALRSLEQQDATGGGCGVYTRCSTVEARSQCPTGVSETVTNSCANASYGNCGTTGPSGGKPVNRVTRSVDSESTATDGGDSPDPLPTGAGFPRCRPDGGDCGQQRGGGE